MRKFLLIAGIILIVAFAVTLVTGILCRVFFYGVLDAPAQLYHDMRIRYRVNFVLAAIFGVLAIAAFIIRSKLNA